MNRYLRIALVATAVVAAFIGVTAVAAQATPAQVEPVCATWKARGATGDYPAVMFGGKPAGTEIGDYSATLTKPTTGTSPGVEFASFDLGVGPLATSTLVSVSYATSDGASTSAGAVRMFAYNVKDANTLTDAPDHQAVASQESGMLVFEVPAGKKIGTLGLVFDASNNTTGKVTFSELTIGTRPVRFTPCPPVHDQITKPVTPSASPSRSPVHKPVSSGGTPVAASLPVTGPGAGTIAAAGLSLIVIGAVGMLVSALRRRKVRA